MTSRSAHSYATADRPRGRPNSGRAWPCLVLSGLLGLLGCHQNDPNTAAEKPTGPDSSADASPPGLASEAGPGPSGLLGRSGSEVRSALGRPQGRVVSQNGVVWIYPEWRVELNREDVVTAVTKERSIKVEPLSPTTRSVAKTPAAGSVRPITVVANGGREVDLASLLPRGKVAIVDFYADWCGPCRKISPILERIAASDPQVVLIKIDIVQWNTPVTRQFGIRSVPNVRVYGLRQQPVGSPTSNPDTVRDYVERAKKG